MFRAINYSPSYFIVSVMSIYIAWICREKHKYARCDIKRKDAPYEKLLGIIQNLKLFLCQYHIFIKIIF